MKKIWFITLICAALGTSACLITEGCTEIGCGDIATIKLNNAAGEITGTLTVNGQPFEIKTTGCHFGSKTCMAVEDDQIRFDTFVMGLGRDKDITVTIDITANVDGVTRSAAQSVMFQETKHYPNGEDCPDECTNRSGTVTLQ